MLPIDLCIYIISATLIPRLQDQHMGRRYPCALRRLLAGNDYPSWIGRVGQHPRHHANPCRSRWREASHPIARTTAKSSPTSCWKTRRRRTTFSSSTARTGSWRFDPVRTRCTTTRSVCGAWVTSLMNALPAGSRPATTSTAMTATAPAWPSTIHRSSTTSNTIPSRLTHSTTPSTPPWLTSWRSWRRRWTPTRPVLSLVRPSSTIWI